MTSIALEFSRPVAIESLVPDKPRSETLEASEAECAALARRFDLQSLSGLKAKLKILRVSDGNIIKIEGNIEAEVVQTCVVSLQPVSAEIKAHFDTYFTEDGKEGLEIEEEALIELDEETPDVVLKDGVLDVGELVAQYLALELDPYPRAPGVSLAAQMSTSGTDAKNNPFQVLQGFQKDGKKDKKKD